MEGTLDETIVSYTRNLPDLSTQLNEKHAENMDLKTKLFDCVQKLVMHPEIPDVRQLIGSGLTSQFTLADVKNHSDSESCWIVLRNKVYDVTEFLVSHPGGEEIILENAGADATVPFESKGHSVDAFDMLEQYCIGTLVKRDHRR